MRALLIAVLLALASPVRAQMTPAVATQDAVRLRTPVLFVWSITPPPEYARWYAAAERCVGLSGDYVGVRWLMAAKPWPSETGSGLTFGMWQDGRRITLNKPESMDSTLVIHEALHDILALNGLNDPKNPHRPDYFGPGKCSYINHPPVGSP